MRGLEAIDAAEARRYADAVALVRSDFNGEGEFEEVEPDAAYLPPASAPRASGTKPAATA